MTLKEELEILRGEPIQVFTGDPMDIPCIETSDPEKLCKHPVVSVNMITYNHEPYIRQAIEGVMMQKTDFEFELVIGEDCSTDRTREICFEYQQRYPDKIRVLWCDHNLYRNPHPAGGNAERNMAHCRGEFVALCEGDDYWIDPLKLQKQVDVMRKYPNVGFCFCGAKIYRGADNKWEDWDSEGVSFVPGVIPGKRFCLWTMFGKDPSINPGPEFFIMTATFLFRKALLEDVQRKYDIFHWRLCAGDSLICLSLGSNSEVYYLRDQVSVYRQMPSGITCRATPEQSLHTLYIRLYFAREIFRLPLGELPKPITFQMAMCWISRFDALSAFDQRKTFSRLPVRDHERALLPFRYFWLVLLCLRFGICRGLWRRLAVIVALHMPFGVSRCISNLYRAI